MSDKHGSRRESRDPDTPDTLAERLQVMRDERRASARASPTSERESITPAPAAKVKAPQLKQQVALSRTYLHFIKGSAHQDCGCTGNSRVMWAFALLSHRGGPALQLG